MENIIVIAIVGLAAGLLGRSYYKKYRKGNSCNCGSTDCPTESSACENPEARNQQVSEIRNSMEM